MLLSRLRIEIGNAEASKATPRKIFLPENTPIRVEGNFTAVMANFCINNLNRVHIDFMNF